MEIKIRKIIPQDLNWVKEVIHKRWLGDFVVTRGKIHQPEDLGGFIAEVKGQKKGLVTFKIVSQEMEIVSLDSFWKRKGLGTALLNKAQSFAKKKNLKRIWLIATNDNLSALRFYQKRGFQIVKVYPNALKISRKLKPEIPEIGENDIPLRDEIELEKRL